MYVTTEVLQQLLKDNQILAPDRLAPQMDQAEGYADQLRAFHPASVEYELEEHEGKYFVRSGYRIILQSDVCTIYASYNTYDKKWSFFVKTQVYKNLDNYAIASISKKATPAPNRIGVLTANKLKAWITYLEALAEQYNAADTENGKDKDEFIQSLEGLDVRYWGDKKQNGEIVKNGIKFSFTIGATYVSKKIELYYEVDATLEAFKQISDNKWIDKKKQ